MRKDSNETRPKVYTLPECSLCSTLKTWLREHGVAFEERTFDTEAQLEFIMRNIFGNPPILEVGSTILPSEEMFDDEVIDEEKVRGVLGI